MTDSKTTIESVLQEQRVFDPPAELASGARIGSLEAYRSMAEAAKQDPDSFWGDAARRELHWFEPFHTVLDWSDAPFARWFEGGTTNLSFNCLDRHLEGPTAAKTALIWEGEPGDVRRFTYSELHAEVCKAANALRAMGIGKGDLVALYMPMVPEAAIAMLACARIGAPHSVVFGGFSAEALRDRLIDGEVKAVITADGGFRKDKPVSLKPAVDAALAGGACPSVSGVLVVQRTKQPVEMVAGRDQWWHELVDWPEQKPVRLSQWPVKTACLCSTPQVRQANQRGWCTPRLVTTFGPISPSSGSSTSVMTTCSGARRMWGGSLATATSSTDPLSNGATTVMFEGSTSPLKARRFLGADSEASDLDLLHRANGDSSVHEEWSVRCRISTT